MIVQTNPQKLVLVGAGLAHLELLRRWALEPILKHVELLFVNPHRHCLHERMIPSLMRGAISLNEAGCDAGILARRAGGIFLQESCQGFDPIHQKVQLSGQGSQHYDYLSFALEALGPELAGNKDNPRVLSLFPLNQFAPSWKLWSAAVARVKNPKIGIVAAGPDGFAYAMALLQLFPQAQLSIFGGEMDTPLQKILSIRQIAFHAAEPSHLDFHEQYVGVHGKAQVQRLDFVVLAQKNVPPPIFQDADLAGPTGFLRISASLNTSIFSNVFGAGDCTEFRPKPLPKTEQVALGQAAVLFKNLRLSVQGRYDYIRYKPRPLEPQLLSVDGDESALSIGPFCAKGPWVARLHKWRQRVFLERYQVGSKG